MLFLTQMTAAFRADAFLLKKDRKADASLALLERHFDDFVCDRNTKDASLSDFQVKVFITLLQFESPVFWARGISLLNQIMKFLQDDNETGKISDQKFASYLQKLSDLIPKYKSDEEYAQSIVWYQIKQSEAKTSKEFKDAERCLLITLNDQDNANK